MTVKQKTWRAWLKGKMDQFNSIGEEDHWHSAPPEGSPHVGHGGVSYVRILTSTSGNRNREIINPGRGATGPERGNLPTGTEAGPNI
jgi:hypothetical protein